MATESQTNIEKESKNTALQPTNEAIEQVHKNIAATVLGIMCTIPGAAGCAGIKDYTPSGSVQVMAALTPEAKEANQIVITNLKLPKIATSKEINPPSLQILGIVTNVNTQSTLTVKTQITESLTYSLAKPINFTMIGSLGIGYTFTDHNPHINLTVLNLYAQSIAAPTFTISLSDKSSVEITPFVSAVASDRLTLGPFKKDKKTEILFQPIAGLNLGLVSKTSEIGVMVDVYSVNRGFKEWTTTFEEGAFYIKFFF